MLWSKHSGQRNMRTAGMVEWQILSLMLTPTDMPVADCSEGATLSAGWGVQKVCIKQKSRFGFFGLYIYKTESA